MTDMHVDRTYALQQPARDMAVLDNRGAAPVAILDNSRSFEQQTEMAAFEKGRMQGEMEAIRRMEAEAPLKQMAPTHNDIAINNLNRPDVLEINRLTNLQRISWLLGEGTAIAFTIMTIVWLVEYRDSFGWGYNGDQYGNKEHFNVGILTFALGLLIHTQAISNYRVLPLNFSASLNRMWYILCQAATITCYAITLAAIIMSTPEAKFWSATEWCFALALAIYVPHAFYSMFRAATERLRPVDYETFAEINSHLEQEPQRGHLGGQGRTTKAHGGAGLTHDNPMRTIYTAAPAYVPRSATHIPQANANVGAQVPVAPANAPRWAELPNTHAEDYFLLARAKWAVVGYFAMGTTFLMFLTQVQHNIAAGMYNWSQDAGREQGPLGEVSNEAKLLSATGLLCLATLVMISYASIPPRTTLIKHGGGIVDARRNSISHNAETRLGHNAV